MAKIICITTGLTGILNASFELVARLQQAGYEVCYASPKNVAEKVSQEGIRFIQLPEIQEDSSPNIPSFQEPFRKVARIAYKIKHARQRRVVALKNTIPAEFVSMLKRETPDLLIIDVELHEYIFKAYAEKQNFILLSQWFSLWKRKGLPYLLQDTIPNQGWKGSQLAMELSWWKIKGSRWWTFTKKKALTVGTDRRSILKILAKQENFPKKYIQENYWPGPFTYSDLPIMSMTAFEMEFPHIPRPNLFYIGPMVYENRKGRIKDRNVVASIQKIFEHRRKINGALLYCSVSTLSKGDELFIKKLIAAVKDTKEWILIISMGGRIAKNIGEGLPANVFPFSYVPQLKILSEAALSINHGGIHTIHECIHFKVPMLVYSGKRSDQNGCAARVAYHELGLMADKDKDSSLDIKRKIKEVLTNNTFRQNIEKMNAEFSKYKKENYLEKVVQDLV